MTPEKQKMIDELKRLMASMEAESTWTPGHYERLQALREAAVNALPALLAASEEPTWIPVKQAPPDPSNCWVLGYNYDDPAKGWWLLPELAQYVNGRFYGLSDEGGLDESLIWVPRLYIPVPASPASLPPSPASDDAKPRSLSDVIEELCPGARRRNWPAWAGPYHDENAIETKSPMMTDREEDASDDAREG